MVELGVTLEAIRACCAQGVARVKGMQRGALSFVVRRCAGWSSVGDRDVGAVRPVGAVSGVGFRLQRSVWLIIHVGVRGCWSLPVMALRGLGVWHVVSRKCRSGRSTLDVWVSGVPIGNRFKRGFSECCGNVPGDVAISNGCRQATRLWGAVG